MRIGELFAGYGGLGMGVQAVLGGEITWVSEYDKGPNKILAHRFPGVPNHGDITAIDWAAVEPVDILTGGFPCQDVSAAGKRAGIRPGTRSGLWTHFAYAIDQLRPRMVVIENVRGLLSARAHSDVEPCAWCVGDDTDGALRALGAVLGDLAILGYDAQWHGLRAADVGAPHGRFRVFIVAYPGGLRRGEGWPAATGEAPSGWSLCDLAGRGDSPLMPGQPLGEVVVNALLPTPTTRDHKGRNQRDDASCLTGALLPTPRASDGTKGGPNQRGSSGDLMLSSAVAMLPTPVEAQRLIPTPSVADAMGGHERRGGARGDELLLKGIAKANQWGQYAAAIARWKTLTRPAPPPTETGPKGGPRLSAAFSEWMMGLPAGWVTDVPGITRNEALKALGNGVVPQQAAAALRLMLAAEVAA